MPIPCINTCPDEPVGDSSPKFKLRAPSGILNFLRTRFPQFFTKVCVTLPDGDAIFWRTKNSKGIPCWERGINLFEMPPNTEFLKGNRVIDLRREGLSSNKMILPDFMDDDMLDCVIGFEVQQNLPVPLEEAFWTYDRKTSEILWAKLPRHAYLIDKPPTEFFRGYNVLMWSVVIVCAIMLIVQTGNSVMDRKYVHLSDAVGRANAIMRVNAPSFHADDAKEFIVEAVKQRLLSPEQADEVLKQRYVLKDGNLVSPEQLARLESEKKADAAREAWIKRNSSKE